MSGGDTAGAKPFDDGLNALIQDLCARGRQEDATRLALQHVQMRATNGDFDRTAIWTHMFADLYKDFLIQYQAQDFEIIDYDLYAVSDNYYLFRGPRPSLADIASGNYICMIGAAQFFGRFHHETLQTKLASHFGIPVLNLSIGGIGPQEYAAAPLASLAQRARLLIVQVLSGRSVGCDEYPGDWQTTRKGSAEKLPREILLREIMAADSREGRRILDKWNKAYVQSYADIANLTNAPKILVWMSSRRPDDWTPDDAVARSDYGVFPQLVSREMLDSVGGRFDEFLELAPYVQDELRFKSRFTGEPCPHFWPDGSERWTESYYPTQSAHDQAFAALRPVVERLLDKPSP